MFHRSKKGQQEENNGRLVGICAASEMRAHCAHAGHDNFNNIICDIYCRSLIVLIFTYFFLKIVRRSKRTSRELAYSSEKADERCSNESSILYRIVRISMLLMATIYTTLPVPVHRATA